MSVKRIDFIAHAYINDAKIPTEVPLEHYVSSLISNPTLGVAYVRTTEWDTCSCCTYEDCGQREIPR